jgi:hypothetical protein
MLTEHLRKRKKKKPWKTHYMPYMRSEQLRDTKLRKPVPMRVRKQQQPAFQTVAAATIDGR